MTTTFERAQAAEPGPARTAAIVAWFQSLYPDAESAPVLVGGAALELYTRGAYRTADIDLVGRVPEEVAAELESVGFARQGRHWVHPGARIFIELPAASFDAPVVVDAVRFGEWTLRVLSPEDVLVDRLAAWKFWKVVAEGVNAFLLWRDRGDRMDAKRLAKRARAESLADALAELLQVSERAPSGEEGICEAESWARKVREP